MFEYGVCRGGDHRAPKTGGSCPCGMVTRIPARKPKPVPVPAAPSLQPDVLLLLAKCLSEGPQALDSVASGLLRERADALLAALGMTGLMGAPTGVERLAA